MEVTDEGITTSFKCLHSSNMRSGMEATEAGISMEVRHVHLAKVFFPMDVIEEGMVKVFRLWQS